MKMELCLTLEHEDYLKQLYDLLVLGDREFIPPLSARCGTTQQGLSDAQNSNGIEDYFNEMKRQSFVLALEGDTLAGFMSFKQNHTGAHISEEDNLYASTCVVHPDFRGRGLMTAFYKEMIRAFPKKSIFTRTWHENLGHLKVLERLGFALIKTIENDRGKGIHTVYYKRNPEK